MSKSDDEVDYEYCESDGEDCKKILCMECYKYKKIERFSTKYNSEQAICGDCELLPYQEEVMEILNNLLILSLNKDNISDFNVDDIIKELF